MPKKNKQAPKPWMKCDEGHMNLTSTIKENLGQCPQCSSQFLTEISSPLTAREIGRRKSNA